MALIIQNDDDVWLEFQEKDLFVKSKRFLNPVSGILLWGFKEYLNIILHTNVAQPNIAPPSSLRGEEEFIYTKSPRIQQHIKNSLSLTTQERDLLNSCYRNTLKSAVSLGCKYIRFPLIYDKKNSFLLSDFLQVAKDSCLGFLLENDVDIYLTIPSKVKKKMEAEQGSTFEDIDLYLKKNYRSISGSDPSVYPEYEFEENLRKHLEQYRQSFFSTLSNFIEEKQTTEVDLYKKAHIDRKLFSKIRSNPNYTPSKNTVLALAIALELDLEETLYLLKYAGYTLSPTDKLDMIVQYFIEHKKYDIQAINSSLFHFTGDTLTGAYYEKIEQY